MLAIPTRGRKNKEKLEFIITIHHLTKIPKNSVLMFVSWKRGRKNVGETQRTLVKDKTAVWEQDFTIKATLFGDGKDKFKKKFLYFYIHEVEKDSKSFFSKVLKIGKKKYLAKIPINLADYAPIKGKDNANATITQSATFWSGTSELKITIKSQKRIGSDTDSALTTDTDASVDDDSNEGDDGDGEDEDDKEVFPDDDVVVKGNPRDKDPVVVKTDSPVREPVKRHERFGSTQVQDVTPTLTRPPRGHDRTMSVDTKAPEKKLDSSNHNSSSFRGGTTVKTTTGATERPRPRRRTGSTIGENTYEVVVESSEGKKEIILSPRTQAEEKERKEEKKEEVVAPQVIQQEINKLNSQEKEIEALQEKFALKEREGKERMLIERLIITTEPQFNKGLPVNAPILFKSIELWDSFGLKKSGYPMKIAKSIRQIVEQNGQSIKTLAFWMSNLCVFLNLLTQEFPLSNQQEVKYMQEYAHIVKEETFGDWKLSFQTTQKSIFKKDFHDDDFKFESPVTQFKVEMQKLLSLTYGKILISVYKELSPYCLPAMYEDTTFIDGRKVTVTTGNLIRVFDQYNSLLSGNGVFHEVINQFYQQVYYFINATVMNAIMSDRKYNTMGYSIYLKMGVTQLENWAQDGKYTMAKAQLEGLRQITNVLMMNKNMLADEVIRKDICPTLTTSQIATILNFYHSDEYDPEASVSSSTLSALGNTKVTPQDALLIFEPVILKNVEFPSWRLVDVPKALQNQDGFDFLFDRSKK